MRRGVVAVLVRDVAVLTVKKSPQARWHVSVISYLPTQGSAYKESMNKLIIIDDVCPIQGHRCRGVVTKHAKGVPRA